MRTNPLHSIIIAFAVVTIGSVVMFFGATNTLRYYQIRNAYYVEKAKADAAEKVIKLAETDCADFDYEVSNSEAYWQYSQIRDLNY